MTENDVPSIGAALAARIGDIEKRVEALEMGSRPVGEEVTRRSPRTRTGEAGEIGAGDLFEIVSVDSRTFERDPDADRCKFSWKVVIQSLASRPLELQARLEFVDMDSYLVEEDSAAGFRLEPGARGKFRGYKWISNEAEYQIVGVRAHVSEVFREALK